MPALVLTWWWRTVHKDLDIQQKQMDLDRAKSEERAKRFVEAVRLLGDELLPARLGAIYSLESLAIDASEERPRVTETLCAFLRERGLTPVKSEVDDDDRAMENWRATTDVQAAFTVVGRLPASSAQIDLRNAGLTSIEGIGSNLVGANLSYADLIDCNLTSARLTDADMSDADLSHADLLGATLDGANLSGTSFTGANLTDASFRGAHVGRADLSSANLTGANLTDANLTDANLPGANLTAAELGGAKLTGANFYGANLSDANLAGADLSDANLAGANLSESDLSTANLRRANFAGTNLRCANLGSANPRNARYDAKTVFAAGFDPIGAGLVLVDNSGELVSVPPELGPPPSEEPAPTDAEST